MVPWFGVRFLCVLGKKAAAQDDGLVPFDFGVAKGRQQPSIRRGSTGRHGLALNPDGPWERFLDESIGGRTANIDKAITRYGDTNSSASNTRVDRW